MADKVKESTDGKTLKSMEVGCAWCGRKLKEVMTTQEDPGVSHGHCYVCMMLLEAQGDSKDINDPAVIVKYLDKVEQKIQKKLDKLSNKENLTEQEQQELRAVLRNKDLLEEDRGILKEKGKVSRHLYKEKLAEAEKAVETKGAEINSTWRPK